MTCTIGRTPIFGFELSTGPACATPAPDCRDAVSATVSGHRRTVVRMRENNAPLIFEEVGLVDYVAAWDRQRVLAQARVDGTGPDTVLLLEHPAVYTAGKRTQPEDRPTDG